MANAGALRGALPGAAAARALRGDRPLGGVRRRHLPPAGPQGRRLPARPDARGGLHAAREGPVLVVQGPAAVDLPDPGQVPRRGAPPRRPAARARVHDEGRLLVRLHGCRSRRLATWRSATPTSASSSASASSTSSSQADAGAMGGSRSEEFLHPTAVGEDTFVRSDGGYAANVEAFTTVVARADPVRRTARAGDLRLAEHADDRDARRRTRTRTLDAPRDGRVDRRRTR